MRKLLAQIIESDAGIEVIGTAINGEFALKKIEETSSPRRYARFEMPGLNGIEVLKQVMRKLKTPVVVVSSHSKAGATITLKALALGAVDFVAKPVDIATRLAEVTRNWWPRSRWRPKAAPCKPSQKRLLKSSSHPCLRAGLPGEFLPSAFPLAALTPWSMSSRSSLPAFQALS